MESKSYGVALLILTVAGLGNCAVDRELRKINFRINNMQQNMLQKIADLEFENRELRQELEGEKNRISELEVKLDSALSNGSPPTSEKGSKGKCSCWPAV